MGDGSRRLEAHTGRAIRRGAVGVDGHRHVEAQLPQSVSGGGGTLGGGVNPDLRLLAFVG